MTSMIQSPNYELLMSLSMRHLLNSVRFTIFDSSPPSVAPILVEPRGGLWGTAGELWV